MFFCGHINEIVFQNTSHVDIVGRLATLKLGVTVVRDVDFVCCFGECLDAAVADFAIETLPLKLGLAFLEIQGVPGSPVVIAACGFCLDGTVRCCHYHHAVWIV